MLSTVLATINTYCANQALREWLGQIGLRAGYANTSLTVGYQKNTFDNVFQGPQADFIHGGKVGELRQKSFYLLKRKSSDKIFSLFLTRAALTHLSSSALPPWALSESGKALQSALRIAVKKQESVRLGHQHLTTPPAPG